MKLTAHEAQVTTAVVEIQTLTISGKQLTLAVFRQLPKRELTAAAAVLWGRVNYHPDKCEPGTYDRRLGRAWPDHVHVVWQLGDELFRSAYEKPYRSIARPAHGEVQEEFDEWFAEDSARWNRLCALPQLFIAV